MFVRLSAVLGGVPGRVATAASLDYSNVRRASLPGALQLRPHWALAQLLMEARVMSLLGLHLCRCHPPFTSWPPLRACRHKQCPEKRAQLVAIGLPQCKMHMPQVRADRGHFFRCLLKPQHTSILPGFPNSACRHTARFYHILLKDMETMHGTTRAIPNQTRPRAPKKGVPQALAKNKWRPQVECISNTTSNTMK